MKRAGILSSGILLISASLALAQGPALEGTFSIIARDPVSGELGMAVQSKTPREIVNRLHAETAKAIESTEVRASMAKLGAEPMLMKLEEFDAYIRNEIKTNAALVKAAGLEIQK